MSNERIAVVTGASTGFGFQTAKKLARDGFRVFGTARDINGRNAEPKRLLEAMGVSLVELDVTDQGSVDRGTAKILEQVGRIDVLVNNAGTAHVGVVEAFTPESVERQFAVNLVGPVRMNRAFLPGMRDRKEGLVIFVSSVAGRLILPSMGLYTASKWALEALAEALSYELRPFGVDVAIVEPGAHATNIFNVTVTPDDRARLAAYNEVNKTLAVVGEQLGQSVGDPVEVADAIARLVKAPAGMRPLRTVVPAGTPAEAINAASAPIQRSVLEHFGLSALLPRDTVGAI